MNLKSKSETESTDSNQRKLFSSKLCSIDCKSARSITIPIRLMSEANLQQHWTKKHARKKEMQREIRYIWKASPIRLVMLPIAITLTRMAPRTLDFDNLVAAFKWARDTVADLLIPGLAPGRADDSDQIEFIYKQEKSTKYGIRIDATECD